jgi:hypothetical protein
MSVGIALLSIFITIGILGVPIAANMLCERFLGIDLVQFLFIVLILCAYITFFIGTVYVTYGTLTGTINWGF